MYQSVPRAIRACGVFAWLAAVSPAMAQFYGGVGGNGSYATPTGYGSSCDCGVPQYSQAVVPQYTQTVSNPCVQPVAMQCVQPVAVQCVQPVVQRLVPVPQTTYRTVPVTEYQEQKVTVQRPVVETEYVEQPVTEYRPVVEQRTAQVPHTTYQTVTECQTVSRDMGQWVTRQEAVCKPSPCEYDPRPGFTGWFNRTSYNMRSAFTPNVRTRREYIPNVVTQTVPVNRTVAVPGTRQVTYNVTKYEPHQTTRRVAVNKVRMVAEEVTRKVPVTVYRSVPSGTSVAWVTPEQATAMAANTGSTSTALAPSSDPAFRSADAGDTKVPTRAGEKFRRDADNGTFKKDPEPFKPGASIHRDRNVLPASGVKLPIPMPQPPALEVIPPAHHGALDQNRDAVRPETKPVQESIERPKFSNRIPSFVRAAPRATPSATTTGPQLTAPSVSVAGSR